MNVVSFYAPRPEHPFFQDYRPFLRLLDESCHRYGHKHIVLTDDPSLSLEFTTLLCELPENLMKATIAAQLTYLCSHHAAEADTLMTGADCVLARDPAEVLAGNDERDGHDEPPFDVALTLGPFADCILNCGAMFFRRHVCNSLLADMFSLALSRCGDEWCDDQKSLRDLLHPQLGFVGTVTSSWPWGLKIKWLPVDPFNLAPAHPGDDCRRGTVVHFRGPRKDWMVDYCHKWLGLGDGITAIAAVNASDEHLLENIHHNSRLKVLWLRSEPENDYDAVLVGGGPSLLSMLSSIRQHFENGADIFALNGAGRWLEAHGIRPHVLITIDARAKNAEFVEGDPAGRYFLASQCHPAVFKTAMALAPDRVYLFHCAMDQPVDRDLYGTVDVEVIGGGIVSGLTAMALCHTLGYRRLHLYGYDSSDAPSPLPGLDTQSHAYAQVETKAEAKRLTVWHDGIAYQCGFAMYKQAEAFPDFARMLVDNGSTITVHGSGLIPALAKAMLGSEQSETMVKDETPINEEHVI